MAWSSWNGGCKECGQYRQRVEFNCSRTQESRPCKCPPEINSRREKSVKFNSTLQVDCLVRGFPQPEVNWTRDGKLLNTTNKLTIKQVTYGDAGQYTCSAKNSQGKSEAAFQVTVTGPPEINPWLINQSVTYNSPLQFNCSLSGFPTPEVLWTRDGINIGKKNTLTIRQARFEDSGEYTCSAKNPTGSKKSTFWIEVKGVSPQIIEPPINQSVTEGNSVNFSCRASGVPTPTLVWVFNDAELPFGINRDGVSFLEFLSVTKGMEGSYKCIAENTANTTSSSATLRVYGKASAQVATDQYPALTAGDNLTLTCIVNEETINVTWKKDGDSPPERAKIHTRFDNKKSELAITEVVKEDSGVYSCEARNKLGFVARSFVSITRKASAQVVTDQYPALTAGDNLTLTCIVNEETINVTWKKDGDSPPERAKIDTRFDNKKSELATTEVVKEDSGVYSCEARNKLGFVARSSVSITRKASAQVVPGKYPALTAGDNLTLTCIVNEETINVTWKKDGDSPPERAKIHTRFDEKMSELAITEVVKEDSGVYSCEARNKLGFVARSFVKINVIVQSFNTLWYYIGGSVAAAIVISLISWYFRKRRRTAMALPDQEQAIQMEPLNAEVDEWEVAVNRVLLQDVIGRGAFGAVWRALLSSPNGQPGNRTVAAKCFTPTAGEEGRKCLMREIELGKLIGENVSPNIVKFMGCVTTEIHPILIMEYLPCGDLLGYLRKCRGVRDRFYLGEGRAQDLNNYDLVLFAKQIAAGMVFLGTRGIIHRDLAARNILLDNNYVCKVTDFGMAYQSFKYGHGNAKKGRLPIKWTAPEILLGELAGLSTLSDVWSYGIVLYEIVTLGKLSYK
nr:vascular endothelial growth factor receptor 3-like [Pocillopora verrucosa]